MKLVSCNVDETNNDVLLSWFVKLVRCNVDETNDDTMLSVVVKFSPFIIYNLSGYVIVDVEVGELLSTIMLLWRWRLIPQGKLEKLILFHCMYGENVVRHFLSKLDIVTTNSFTIINSLPYQTIIIRDHATFQRRLCHHFL